MVIALALFLALLPQGAGSSSHASPKAAQELPKVTRVQRPASQVPTAVDLQLNPTQITPDFGSAGSLDWGRRAGELKVVLNSDQPFSKQDLKDLAKLLDRIQKEGHIVPTTPGGGTPSAPPSTPSGAICPACKRPL